MAEVTTPKVTLIQSKNGQVKTVRIDGTEISVLSAGPTLIDGKMGVSIVMRDIVLDAEPAVEEAVAGA